MSLSRHPLNTHWVGVWCGVQLCYNFGRSWLGSPCLTCMTWSRLAWRHAFQSRVQRHSTVVPCLRDGHHHLLGNRIYFSIHSCLGWVVAAYINTIWQKEGCSWTLNPFTSLLLSCPFGIQWGTVLKPVSLRRPTYRTLSQPPSVSCQSCEGAILEYSQMSDLCI